MGAADWPATVSSPAVLGAVADTPAVMGPSLVWAAALRVVEYM